MSKALVVLSGGQDSTTCLYWAKQKFKEVHAVTFDYGQRHRVELEAARKVASLAGVASHEVIALPNILESTSPLTSDNPLETYTSFKQMDEIIGDRVELTFVPMRNAVFVNIAANRAVARGASNLVVGVCQEDNANYPDCRGEFVQAQQEAIRQALGVADFAIHAPLLTFSKADTVRMAKQLDGCWEALRYSHTCYAGTTPPCGVCHACVLRAEGFKQAGEVDPIYEVYS
jgi:7-cyano-7-deazaguanine synthase